MSNSRKQLLDEAVNIDNIEVKYVFPNGVVKIRGKLKFFIANYEYVIRDDKVGLKFKEENVVSIGYVLGQMIIRIKDKAKQEVKIV